MIRRAQRGRLKVYLGFAPGVGKTYQMLQEGHRLKKDRVDVVVGVVEHHDRAETKRLIDGLERVPMRSEEYHGINVEEMDLDAIITRKPEVVLVDELAHTNLPGSRNSKRYEDVRDLIAAGIHVISTLNVQHLESLYDTVEKLIGVKVRERLPDSILAEADQVVNVDLAAEDLQQRLRDGKIYPRERVANSLENFFTESNLGHLRELTLREVANQLDFHRRELKPDASAAPVVAESGAPDQIMVCLSSRGPNSARLLRFGSRLAGRLNRNWYALYVQTPSEEPTVIDSVTQRIVGETLTLANQLGATVFTFKGTDVAETILRFAEEYRVGQIVIGSPRPISWWQRVLLNRRSVAEDLIMQQRGVTVVVVDAEINSTPESSPAERAEAAKSVKNVAATASPASSGVRRSVDVTTFLNEKNIIFFEEPVTREAVLRQLAAAALAASSDGPSPEKVLELLNDREKRGSTFLNEGVALPHARVEGLAAPLAALAITRSGVLDAGVANPIDVVFLLVAPVADPGIHLRALAAAGRVLSNRETRRALLSADSAGAAMNMLL